MLFFFYTGWFALCLDTYTVFNYLMAHCCLTNQIILNLNIAVIKCKEFSIFFVLFLKGKHIAMGPYNHPKLVSKQVSNKNKMKNTYLETICG